jgi:trans-aconitate 2-methyltransferase
MSRDTWNPQQYDRFRQERSQPFYDLMALVRPRPHMRVVDLGCGTGELTRELHHHLQARETLGLDSSEAMLRQSAALAGDGLQFQHGDIETFGLPAATAAPTGASRPDHTAAPTGAPRTDPTASPPTDATDADPRTPTRAGRSAAGDYDLIFSNAALHWVADHPTLLLRLAGRLAPGGQLAVQVPANDDHPSHVLAAELAAETPFREALGGYVRRSSVLPPERYAVLLDQLGFGEQHVRLQVYGHHLASRDEVPEWVRGSLLTDYQRRLTAGLFEGFLEQYRERLRPRLEDSHPYFYAFKRVLFWAQR